MINSFHSRPPCHKHLHFRAGERPAFHAHGFRQFHGFRRIRGNKPCRRAGVQCTRMIFTSTSPSWAQVPCPCAASKKALHVPAIRLVRFLWHDCPACLKTLSRPCRSVSRAVRSCRPLAGSQVSKWIDGQRFAMSSAHVPRIHSRDI